MLKKNGSQKNKEGKKHYLFRPEPEPEKALLLPSMQAAEWRAKTERAQAASARAQAGGEKERLAEIQVRAGRMLERLSFKARCSAQFLKSLPLSFGCVMQSCHPRAITEGERPTRPNDGWSHSTL